MSTSEIFDADTVKGTIEGIGTEFQSLSSLIQSINSTVTTALGSPDNAMYGDAGNKVLATWDENCSTLNEFIKIYDSWSSMAVAIGNEYGNLQEGTAVVQDADKEAFQTIANANKSSWLKTEDAKTAYKGSTSTYKDAEGNDITITKNLVDGIGFNDTNEDGTKITKNTITEEELNKAKETLKASYKTQYDDMQQKLKERKEMTIFKGSQELKEEFDNADEKYSSKNTFMTITNKDVNGANLRVTHIIIKDPSQIKTIQSNGAYGNGGESIYSMAKRTNNLVVAATGAFFKEGGQQNLLGTNNGVVADSKLVASKSSVTGGNEICIDKKGKIFYAPAGVSWDSLIKDYGVTNTYASHEAKRLDNGQIQSNAEWNKSYDRTYLCMKEPGEYYLIQGTTTPGNAVTYAKDVLGCQFAGSLEQGSAVAEVTNKGVIQEHTGYDTISNAFAIVDV